MFIVVTVKAAAVVRRSAGPSMGPSPGGGGRAVEGGRGEAQRGLTPIRRGGRAANHPADRRERERGAEQHAGLAARQREIRYQRRRRDQEGEEQQVVEVEDPADE